ncbi:MAG TPA: protein kinase [Gemmatimonadales bacterium]|nr:protein kinase [Gemmatimonadales bacterium]
MTDALGKLTNALADRYVVERELGAGGMATVYLAHDVRHDRKVALKVLRPELAAVLGAERFVVEIRTTAALQHPHILSLFDSGTADGFLYYVMPYIEGETLRDKLNRETQLGIEEAVRITTEVADALDYAHRHGVIHRDIKPENILLHDGRPMVADFGIALAVSAAAGGRMTETGMSLGTPHYMSPEQATAEKEISGRSDIYSLASVLYEMLAGQPPHVGGSAQQIIMKIIAEEAQPVTSLRKSVPPNVAEAVGKALERLPADRFSSAAEFAQALKDPHFTDGLAGTSAHAGAAAAARPWWREWQPWGVALTLAAVGLVIGRLVSGAEAPLPPVGRFNVPVSEEQGVTGAPVNSLALSPDGGTLVYVGRSSGGAGFQLYQRRLAQLEPFHPIPGSESGAFPIFSPDGTQLAFMGPGGAKVLPVPFTGAPPVSVAANVQTLGGVIWLDNASLVMTDTGGRLVRAGLDGSVRTFARPDTAAGERNLFPQVGLPDGRTVIAIASRNNSTLGRLLAVDSRDGSRAPILETDVNEAWYAQGVLLWCLGNGALQAAPFDARRHRITGPAVTLAEGVRQAVGGGGQVAVSDNGPLVYLPEEPFNLTLLDLAGHREVVAQGRRFHSPRFSPDGSRLVTDFLQQGSRDVWTLDLRQRTLSRLSFENDGHDPVWSRDGRWVYYVHGAGIWRRRADGGGGADSVYTGNLTQALEFTAGGATVGASGNGPFDLVLLSADAPYKATPLVATPFDEEAGTLSPDGRWLAYTSDETGRPEVYVRPFPSGGGKFLVSQGFGSEPRWAPDGRTLYYRGLKNGAQYLVAAHLLSGAAFGVTSRTPLFEITDFDTAEPHANWDVSRDGKRFVMVDEGPMTEMVFVLNWPVEVRHGARRATP